MSVLLETSVGDIVIDLLVDYAPRCCENFLKLCKVKYYNYSPIYLVQKDFSFQTGDPIGPGSKDSDGGSSIWGLLDGPSKKTFEPEFHKKLKHTERGTVSMATAASSKDSDERLAGSQFIITLGDTLEYLDDKAAIFGKVVEGFDAVEAINTAFVDDTGRPLKDIRIRHTVILDDPFDDPSGLVVPPSSPLPSAAQLATVRIADDEELDENADQETVEKLRREREARAQALTLEMVGDLPFAEVAPPENVLFVCKLNPVTRDEDLDLIFSRFGKILSCEVIRDKRTGDSLQYAFIEFEKQEQCEMAYFKMQGVLIDDHRIHVDFSQSVAKLSDSWRTATNEKRQRRGGGFGGIEGLEKKRQYRAEVEREDQRPAMVFDRNEGQRQDSTKDGRREREREREHEYEARDRHRSRSRSPWYSRNDNYDDRKYHRNDRYGDDRKHHRGDRRDRSKDHYRDNDRKRERSRNWDRDRYRDERRRH
ncbi:cyclophilin-like protein [Patellaria atrata CBS 101060]|uniref:Peptidyl-prolyl cis-trans isomerase n=1 Tax=Patellaria atrata CBS 101060 TaxID=1346257 RepID=A0A9P4SBL9_9PEZI|nr:cyclophilin-like protein [Patellaria atrata CBS 101060]